MAFTPGTENIKLITVDEVEFDAGLIISGDTILDGVSFVDATDLAIRMASGVERSVSEKTDISFDIAEIEDANLTTLLGYDRSTQMLTFSVGTRSIRVTGVVAVHRMVKTNGVTTVNVSLTAKKFDIDSISILT
jgi:hypothetical protein